MKETERQKIDDRFDILENKVNEIKEQQMILHNNLDNHQNMEEKEFRHISKTLEDLVRNGSNITDKLENIKQITGQHTIRLENNEAEILRTRESIRDIYTKLSTMNYKSGVIAGTISLLVSLVLILIKS